MRMTGAESCCFSLEKNDRCGNARIVRDGDVPLGSAGFVRERERVSCQLEAWSTARASSNLDLVPTDTRCAIERFGEGFFHRKASGESSGDVASGQIGAFTFAANSCEKAVAVALQRASHAFDRADIDAYAHHAHELSRLTD